MAPSDSRDGYNQADPRSLHDTAWGGDDRGPWKKGGEGVKTEKQEDNTGTHADSHEKDNSTKNGEHNQKNGGPARAHKGKGLKEMFFLFKMIGRDACPGRR
jgi:hypothetical protein